MNLGYCYEKLSKRWTTEFSSSQDDKMQQICHNTVTLFKPYMIHQEIRTEPYELFMKFLAGNYAGINDVDILRTAACCALIWSKYIMS